MSTGTATIGGGSSVHFSLNPKEVAAAQQALAQLEAGFPSINLLTDAGAAASPTAFDIYNLTGGSFTLPDDAEAVVLTGKEGGSIRGHLGSEVLIGNQGNDTINAAGGNAAIIVGDGRNTIQLNDANKAGGSASILTGKGENTINLWGGSVTVSAVGGSNGDDDHGHHGNAWASDGGRGKNDDDKAKGSGHDKDHDHGKAAGSNDAVNVYSGDNTVTSASAMTLNVQGGSNVLNLSGDDRLTLSGGSTTVNLAGGASKIANLGGANTFNLTGGGDDTFTGGGAAVHQDGPGDFRLTLSGNDTITLGSGSDTIVEAGKATVYAGSGALNYRGGDGASYVVAGSGASTLIGGGGNDTFVGGSGPSSMLGGGGANLFIGGHGSVTMDGGGGGSNLFSFDKANVQGATDQVRHFTSGQDHIQLVGYDTAAALASAHVVGGNTIISLDGGATRIELVGFKHLTASDFKT